MVIMSNASFIPVEINLVPAFQYGYYTLKAYQLVQGNYDRLYLKLGAMENLKFNNFEQISRY